ncbi:MAG: cobalamin-dependent protein, partial [Sulfurospirillaceae bacterium]
MKEIVLTTFNARYSHTSLALRCLQANLKEFEDRSQIVEFIINSNVTDALEEILTYKPKIVAISTYIWNATHSSELIELLKLVAPEITIIIGGPEASHFPHRVDFSKADYVVQGEGEISFYELIKDLFEKNPPKLKIINGKVPDLKSIKLPYDHY